MIATITQVIGSMPDTYYMVLVTIDSSTGEAPAYPMRRTDRYAIVPFQVGESVHVEVVGNVLYVTTPEDIDVQECG